jgi:hypothetical protein
MRLLFAAALLVLLPGIAKAFWLATLALLHAPMLGVLLAGALAGVVVEHFVLRRLPRIGIFEHELTHALVALLFLRRVDRIEVRRDSGSMRSAGGFGGSLADDLIGLAPYLLPTFTLGLTLVRPLAPAAWFPWFDGWIGFTFGFHFWSGLDEFRHNGPDRALRGLFPDRRSRTDIGRRGSLYSLVFIVTLTLAVHGLIFALLLGGYRAAGAWGREVWATTLVVGAGLWRWAADLLGRVRAERGIRAAAA